MKHYYRLIDAAVQVMLLATWLYALLAHTGLVHILYFIVGGWYVLSLTIHFVISTQKFQNTYRRYANISIALVVLPVAGIFVLYLLEAILVAEEYLLVYVIPALTLLYAYSCIAEIRYLRKRPISYLK